MRLTGALTAFLVLGTSTIGALDVGFHVPPHWSGSASRIASVTLMTDEYLVDLVPLTRLAALSRAADDPVLSNVGASAKLVPGRVQLDLEQLLSLHPDLVVAADWSDRRQLAFLEDHGIAIEILPTPRRWSEVLDNIRRLGRDLKVEERAADLVKSLNKQTTELSRRRALIVHPVSVIEYNAWGTSMGSRTLWDDLVRMAGLENLSAGLPTDEYGSVPLSEEVLLRLDPDWLVVPSPSAALDYHVEDLVPRLRADPVLSRLRSVRTGHVLQLSEAWKTSTSHDALQSAWALQNAAYPNLR